MEDIEALYRKFLEKRCSREEAETLLRHFQNQANSVEILNLIEAELDNPEAFTESPEDQKVIARNRIKLRESILGKRRTISPTLWLPYAAAILVFLSIGIGIYWYNADSIPSTQLTSKYGDDVLPGGDRATLTLADGSTIDLESALNGMLVQLDGISVTKDKDGIITYEMQSEEGMGAAVAAFNTISTPRGGQYQIILPDGTKAWLNAESSLRFPVKFDSKKRIVELSGEGYFEVRHNASQPFYVTVGDQSVEVLGTDFNVNAYGDEYAFITTLVNGSVRVSNNNSVQSVTLMPGQQAILKNNQFDVHKIDPADYIAWKDGLITLSNADLPAIARQLERWYDIEFDSSNLPKGQSLNGELPATTKLSGILDALELNTGVRFRIEGRRVTTEE